MEYKRIYSWDFKNISLFTLLIFLPNFLGMINLNTTFGFKLHFFQYGIFLAAIIYGPFGGALSGLIGSIFSVFMMNNPYIAIGNAILGFFVGYFVRKKLNTVLAVIIAFIIQLPWLILTDIYLMNLSIFFIISLILALTISNLIWAIAAHYTVKLTK